MNREEITESGANKLFHFEAYCVIDDISKAEMLLIEKIYLLFMVAFGCMDIYKSGFNYYLYLNKRNPITYLIFTLFAFIHFVIKVITYLSKVLFLTSKGIYIIAKSKIKWINNNIDSDLFLYEIITHRGHNGKAD